VQESPLILCLQFSSRWTEFDTLQADLNRVNVALQCGDAPVECARIFYARTKAFMNNWVTCKRHPILGRILHWFVRYETQSRDAVHAHILLWVHPEDAARVKNEVTAAVPAHFDDEAKQWVMPADPLLCRLANQVIRKNMHTCSAETCSPQGRPCKLGFPLAPHFGDTCFDEATKKYKYYRPGHAHRNVVSYHPKVSDIAAVVLLYYPWHFSIPRCPLPFAPAVHSAWWV
jgi:hypothetical protein